MSRKSGSRSIDLCRVADFIIQLVDNSLLVYMFRALGLLIIEVATVVVMIELLRIWGRDGLFGAHKLMRHLGQTFVGSLVILVTPPFRFLTDLSCNR